MSCSDSFITYLKSYGYSVIRLPKADVKPLQILAKQGGKDLDRLGELTTLLVSGSHIDVPKISENTPAANINGQRSSDLSIGVGLSILGSVIGAMGGSTLGLDVKYQQAKVVAFEFHDVLEDRIELAKLDQYLADADVSPFSRYVGQLLEADQLYVTTATIKSTKFTVQAKKSDGIAVGVSVPEIQQVVGGTVKVSGQADVTSAVTYEGSVSLVFGFQAVQLFYVDGRYTAFVPLDTGVAMRALENVPDDGTKRLVSEGPFLRLISE